MTSRSPETSAVAGSASPRGRANAEAAARICEAEPMLVDVRSAIEVVPGMTSMTILTSGAPLRWDEYTGGQRNGIIGGALFEGLAADAEEAVAKIAAGEILIRPCQGHGCAGSLAGIYTASMPVFVVEDERSGRRGFCNLFEGVSPYRLNYGVYNDDVRRSLLFLQEVVGPLLGEAVRIVGGVPLRPIMRRALHMGDELHSRNTAATVLFTRELFPGLLELEARRSAEVREALEYLRASDYFFLRLSMASAKATADAAHGIEGSSLVTAMIFNCRDFAIRVSGLDDVWFRGPLPEADGAKLFESHTEDEIEFMGGESTLNETVGLGGFAQAAAFPLQDYQGGSAEAMVRSNEAMYEITVGEHPEYKIPYFGFRGVPVGIDIHRVVETGITPVLDIGLAGKRGGQIGAGRFRARPECFLAAVNAYDERYA
jgi:Protein of unknown function (DUF1116)